MCDNRKKMNLKYDEKTKSKSGATISHSRITHLSDFAGYDYHPCFFGFIEVINNSNK